MKGKKAVLYMLVCQKEVQPLVRKHLSTPYNVVCRRYAGSIAEEPLPLLLAMR